MYNPLVILLGIICFFLIYPLIIYPLLIIAAGFFRKRETLKKDITPSISLIITAYNEAESIKLKLENTLELDYPQDKLEIIVASDASTDKTDEIVRSFADRNVKLVALPYRGGKSMAQNAALAEAAGEIIVHTDATAMLPAKSLRRLVSAMADPQVGCVTSHDRSIGSDTEAGIEGAGLYTRYEIKVRESESRLKSLIGVSGSYYAVRRKLRPPLAPEVIDDFYIPLWVIRNGYRVVPEPQAVALIRRSRDSRQEYQRRVRTFLTGMRVFFRVTDMLNPFKFGLTSFQLLSHKLARWLMPFLLIGLLITSAVLAKSHWLYAALLGGQLALYGLAYLAHRKIKAGRRPGALSSKAYFLVLINIAILDAWSRLVRGESFITWEPTRR